MRVHWVYAFIDRPAERFESAATFWTTVLKWPLSPRRGEHDEFATLVPPEGDAYVKLQAVEEGGGMHLDLSVADVRALADRAAGLGARVVADHDRYVVLASPGGQLFCAVPWHGEARRPPRAARSSGRRAASTRSSSMSTRRGADERARLLGRAHARSARPARTAAGSSRPSGAADLGSPDLACSDRTLVRAWHERNGATVVAEHPQWTVMRDPAGGVYRPDLPRRLTSPPDCPWNGLERLVTGDAHR
jgi:predicted enzyme related to lactoylglutathione lyase